MKMVAQRRAPAKGGRCRQRTRPQGVVAHRAATDKPRHAARRDEERQQRLENAADAIAIEVERISEAQRFMVGLLADPASARRVERGELVSPDRKRSITPH